MNNRFHTGDIIFVNSVTVLSRITRRFLRQQYGHIGLIVTLDNEPHVYEIAAGSSPRLVPLVDYLDDPIVTDAAIRRLQYRLAARQEEEMKRIILHYRDITYPPLSSVMHRFLGGDTTPMRREMVCSDLIASILRDIGIPLSNGTLLPDSFLPGTGQDGLDAAYIGGLEEILSRKYSGEKEREMMSGQFQDLSALLTDNTST